MYLKFLVGYKFMYKKHLKTYSLYCYNGKYWVNDEILLRRCIETTLHDFLEMLIIKVYGGSKTQLTKLSKLKTIDFKRKIIETYKEYGVNEEVEFDKKWWLFGFNDCVYDMEEERIRNYKYDDYVSITCGYNWREPSENEIAVVNYLLDMIFPIAEEKDAVLQILCTGIEGRCLEKFVIFNGSGGNGKGVLNDLMLKSLGEYGFLGNNSILFEKSRTGSNPEKSNMHKKRYVVFREPSERCKFENSIIKELTGGGSFSARTHNEKDTEKELNLTMVIECNKRPLFSEEPKNAEIRRIVDILFRSTFVDNEKFVDNSKNIYLAQSMYKGDEFHQKYKFAFLKILFNHHKKYYKLNNSRLILPESIIERTNMYLELSCNVLQWFKENYKKSSDVNNIVQIKDIYSFFCGSDYFSNLSKFDKRTYNKSFFVEYFKTNVFLSRYFSDRNKNIRNLLIGWERIIQKDENEDVDENVEKFLDLKIHKVENKYLTIKNYFDKHILNNDNWMILEDKMFITILEKFEDVEIIEFKNFYNLYIKSLLENSGDRTFVINTLIKKIKTLYLHIINKLF